MSGPRQFHLASLVLFVALGHWSSGAFSVRGQVPQRPSSLAAAAPSPWRDDADLRDVYFLDLEHGWAVGDLGVIWHTSDGGESWRRQASPVACQLTAVHFVDRQQGWAVGGFSYPLTHRSVGVVLRTADGGRVWEEVPGLLIPWLTSVHFSDQQRGFAAGAVSPSHTSGVFSTQDGGRTWSPVAGVAGFSWAAGSLGPTSALCVGPHGRVAWRQGMKMVGRELAGLRPWDNVAYAALVDDHIGFVGFGGRPWISVDQGGRWQPVGPLPATVEDVFRFQALAVSGGRCWLAGIPGTRVFRSLDHARSWEGHETGALLPINKLHFSGDRGWAVGASGQIMATSDGGATWKTQRGGGKRAALLAICGCAEDIPWELLAKASAAADYRVHVVLLSAETSAALQLQCPWEQRLVDATARIGASCEVMTHLPSPSVELDSAIGDVMRSWQAVDKDAPQQLTARLAVLIRTWRPEVVLVSLQPRRGESPSGLQRVTAQLTSAAVELAASEASTQDLAATTNLPPWRTTRTVAVRSQNDGPSSIRDEFRMAAGAVNRPVSSLATRSRQLLGTEATKPTAWTLTSVSNKTSPDRLPALGRDPFGAAPLKSGSAARRPRVQVDAVGVAERERDFQKTVHIRNVLLRGDKLIGEGASLLEQTDRLLVGLDSEVAGDILFEMADLAIADSDLQRADALYRRLVGRHGEHELSDYATAWLMAYHTSSEVAWRTATPRQVAEVSLATAQVPVDDGPLADAVDQGVEDATDAKSKWQTAFRLASEIQSKRPALYAEPAVAFPLAAISRDEKRELQVRALYRRQLGLPTASPWRGIAAAELALLDAPVPGDSLAHAICRSVDAPPHLDGDLSDDCWRGAQPIYLQPPASLAARDQTTLDGAEPDARVYFSHDQQYFYLAAQCSKKTGVTYVTAQRPRRRDADLADLDRIEVRLDVNRDYASWWRLVFDQRGWTAESIMGDAQWDPTYYVASQQDDSQWSIEVAIPWAELAPPSLRSGANWAVGLRRIIPGHSIQSWPKHGESPPAVAGLLYFDD